MWALLAGWAVIDLVTYFRIEPDDLYHVSHGGLAGGFSRALVFLNFPAAPAAIAIVLLVADRAGWSGFTHSLSRSAQ